MSHPLFRESPVEDFKQECTVLYTLLDSLNQADWNSSTLFKHWTPTDIVIHLHFWNQAALMACSQEAQFMQLLQQIQESFAQGTFANFEKSRVENRYRDLAEVWYRESLALCEVWQTLDLKRRIKWVGPDMSLQSSITARQMETWAHGQALFDGLGLIRPESDRLLNIVYLGVNTFRWSFLVHHQTPPEAMPRLYLVSPEGHSWHWEASTSSTSSTSTETVRGSAVEFCQVVTQTRNIADTHLQVEGEVAATWLAQAQCFAGPPEIPPPAGSRYRQERPRVV
ncbi:MAG: TIGR03084 family metal-binding protein [Gammaproteobacteria bacterium]|nr:TIGR03084 family metal-binding protein [Gammaproteobacteria bacterium]